MAQVTSLYGAVSTGYFVWDLLLLLVIGYTVQALWSWRRLSHVPGPFFNSMSSLPLLRVNLSGHSHSNLSDLTSRYDLLTSLGDIKGSLVRIGPNTVITTDFRHAQRMEALKSPYRKGPWYGTFRFQKGKDHSFCMVDEEKHAALRTKIGPGYSASNLVEEAIDRQLSRLIDLVDRKYLSTNGAYQPVDFAVLSQLLSIDIVGDMCYGKPFGFLDDGKDIYDWVKWNEGFFPIASTAATLPILSKIIQIWPMSELLPKPRDAVGLGRFIKFAQDSLDERFGPGAEARRDMIAMFLKHGANKEEATGEALVQVVAGTDSVAVAIRMTLLYVLTTPRVYNLLLTELDGAAKTGVITTPIRDAEAKRLPYLQAVIREGLRVFPSLTPLLAKSVPAEGDAVAGHFLPGGTEVGIDGWGILRSHEYWGPDAHAFRPERWLDAGKEQLEDMSECLEILFGYGKYKCLGRGIAIMEINKVLPELLRRYDFTILDPTAPIKKMHSAAFWLMTDFWVTVTPRRSG